MFLTCHIRVVHFFGMLKKEKHLHEISMFTFTKFFLPGLPYLGAQIRCAQSCYTDVRTDLKYALIPLLVPFFLYVCDIKLEYWRV